MKQRFIYHSDVEQAKQLIEFQLMDFYKGAKLESDFMDYHNDTCPRCQKKLKVLNNTVNNIGSVSGFYFTRELTIYMYAICKPCSSEIVILSHRQQKTHSDKAKRTEDYILGQLSKLTNA